MTDSVTATCSVGLPLSESLSIQSLFVLHLNDVRPGHRVLAVSSRWRADFILFSLCLQKVFPDLVLPVCLCLNQTSCPIVYV